MWDGFFAPKAALEKLGLTSSCGDILEFGCGYGTFTIPAAQIVQGTVFTLDIDSEMLETTRAKANALGLQNVEVQYRDFAVEGSDLPDESVDFVMLFNILHAEEREVFLKEARRVLRPGGRLAIIHWNYDPSTPRGPSMEIRPRPEQCRSWAEQIGFVLLPPGIVDLPPYHYGFVFEKPKQ